MFWTAFLLGLASSIHCIGMCGPIAVLVPGGSFNSPANKLAKIAAYNSGRILTYGLLGLILGVFGKGIYLLGMQQNISILFGVLIILGVLFPYLLKRYQPNSKLFSFINQLKKKIFPLLQKRSVFSSFTVGSINALLPCGMVYLALAGAVLTGDFYESAQFMILFGLGTSLTMILVSFGSSFLLQYRTKMLKILPVFMFGMGVLFILRGMNLGIPYVSPRIETMEKVKCH